MHRHATAGTPDLLRQQIEVLAKNLRAHVKLDPCRDPVIQGRCGNIHADGSGYSVAVMLQTARQWTSAKNKLRFCVVRQDGDTEGVVLLATKPTRSQAAVLRQILGIKKRPDFSAATLAAKRAAFKKSAQTPMNRELPASGAAILRNMAR
ncbi:MAG TPA: hypothetical protein VGP72_02060 [Planctomycetota bacterium]